jgi:hypothetical protein
MLENCRPNFSIYIDLNGSDKPHIPAAAASATYVSEWSLAVARCRQGRIQF